MRRLLIFRHSKAERAGPGQNDRTRVLAESGRADARKLGVYMAKHEFKPDWAWVSDAARTQETWKIAAAAFDPAPDATVEPELYNAGPDDILAVLRRTPASASTVVVVGHNPGMQEVTLLLTASGDVEMRERVHEKFPTSGLAIIEFALPDWASLHPNAGRLERYISPKMLEPATR